MTGAEKRGKERGHIPELPSVEGCWQAAPGGKGAEPLPCFGSKKGSTTCPDERLQRTW